MPSFDATLKASDVITGVLHNPTLQGDSAYAVAVQNGFEGTEQEWLASLKGEKGEDATISDEVIVQAVEDYLDENPIEAPVTSVNSQTGDVVITAQALGALTEHQDISGKADLADLADVATTGDYDDLDNKPSIPTKVSDLTNDSGFITGYTETDPTVPSWAKASSKPSYTASEVGALPNTTVIPSKTSDLTNDSGFLTQHQDISGKANISDLSSVATSGSYTDLSNKPSIPSKTSDLTNDSGFLTSHQDISGKADKATTLAGYGITNAYTKSEVDSMIGDIETLLSAI